VEERPTTTPPPTSANWKGATADWNTPADWSDGIVPNNSTTNVTIGAAGAYTLSIAAGENFAAGTVSLSDASATFKILGALNENGAFSINAGDLELDNGATLTVTGSFTNSGTVGLHNSSTVTAHPPLLWGIMRYRGLAVA
jgi:hypothetical protein